MGAVFFKMSGKTGEGKGQPAKDSKDNKDDLSSVKITHVKDLKVKVGDKKLTVAYRKTKCDEAKLDILFLHGMSFKSETWVSFPVWTLQLLYKTGGFRAVAIDLPGFGDSPAAEVDNAAFIEAVIDKLNLNAPVIVSPSMSGEFAMPYLFKDPPNVLKRARGFVPVAPVGTESYDKGQYKDLKIPTLLIYGGNDKHLGPRSKKDLENLPEIFEEVELAGAGHACYMNKPDEFHEHLIKFLKSLIK